MKRLKSIGEVAVIGVVAIYLANFFFSFVLPHQIPKTYPVKLTQQEWGSRLQTIQSAKVIMRQSTLPGNVVSAWTDSLDVMASDIQKQVGAELQAEIKKDSVKPKK